MVMVVIASKRLRVRQNANDEEVTARFRHAITTETTIEVTVSVKVAAGAQYDPSSDVRTSVTSGGVV
jgi:hypothetical protein